MDCEDMILVKSASEESWSCGIYPMDGCDGVSSTSSRSRGSILTITTTVSDHSSGDTQL